MWKLYWILDREKKTSSFYFNVLSLSEAGHLMSEPTCDWLTNVAIKSEEERDTDCQENHFTSRLVVALLLTGGGGRQDRQQRGMSIEVRQFR